MTSDTKTQHVTPGAAVAERDINYTVGTLDKDKNFHKDSSKDPPTVTLKEKQTAGNDKPIICDPSCSAKGVFPDAIYVSGPGKTFTVEQHFEIDGKPATIYKMEGGKLISGTSQKVVATDKEVTVTLIP